MNELNRTNLLRLTITLSLLWAPFAEAASKPKRMEVPSSLSSRLKSFEPSAGLYLGNEGYLVASDDTDKKDSPWLFLMDEDGAVAEEPLKIKGVKKMTDIESLSQDENGDLFILSSQGLNKKGKNLKERQMFVHAKRDGTSLTAVAQTELREPLLAALKNAKDPDIKAMKSELDQALDIESSFVKDGDLFVGIKEPQPSPGVALILNLGPAADILAGEAPAPKVWRKVDFRAISGATDLLSDVAWAGERLVLSSTTAEGEGKVWSMDDNELALQYEFPGNKPEGLAWNPENEVLTVFFDEGEGDALYLHTQLK